MKRSDFLRILLLAPLGVRQACAAPSPTCPLDYLLSRQSADGSWRSDVYGAFRDGRALTPHVLQCLSFIDDPSLKSSKEMAARWLLGHRADLFATFPVHIASALLEATTRIPALNALRQPALDCLLSLQSHNGGWSYSPIPPPADPATPLAPMRQPNLSATTIAIDGLRAAGGAANSISRALPFIRTCQNHRTGDPDFDDGGFFQMPLDSARNKAGRSGTDHHGNPRFTSYAAATADGLRCLLTSGTPPDAPRVLAARAWLDKFTWSPTAPPPDLAYYAARSISSTARLRGGATRAAQDLATRLNKVMLPAGAWRNTAGEMRENCPLVATALALEAIHATTTSQSPAAK